jgi:hypothetical protein
MKLPPIDDNFIGYLCVAASTGALLGYLFASFAIRAGWIK